MLFFFTQNNGKMYIFDRNDINITFMAYDNFHDFSCISSEFCDGRCIGKRKFSNIIFNVFGDSHCLSNAPDGEIEYPLICQYVRFYV